MHLNYLHGVPHGRSGTCGGFFLQISKYKIGMGGDYVTTKRQASKVPSPKDLHGAATPRQRRLLPAHFTQASRTDT